MSIEDRFLTNRNRIIAQIPNHLIYCSIYRSISRQLYSFNANKFIMIHILQLIDQSVFDIQTMLESMKDVFENNK